MIQYTAREPDNDARRRSELRWNAVAKPLHSLGNLETIISQIAAVQRNADPVIDRRCVLVFCADNGVVREGVSQSGQEVSSIVAKAIAEGSSNINLMASAAGADVFCVDMGLANKVSHAAVIDRSISCGTRNIAEGPAMTRVQAEQAIQTGIDLVAEMQRRGYQIIAVGEMGIGNTTTTAAVTAALLRCTPDVVTGRGAGLSNTALRLKKAVICEALAVNQPDPNDPIDVLAKVGGYDIAAMCGVCLGGMTYGVPVVLDGVISACAALCAVRICPSAASVMIPSHISREPAATMIFDELSLQPILHAGLALGEGTGAVLLLPMLDAALNVYRSSHTFEGIGIEAYTEVNQQRHLDI